jgi:hypothetical protein
MCKHWKLLEKEITTNKRTNYSNAHLNLLVMFHKIIQSLTLEL